MHFDVISIFPSLVNAGIHQGVIGRALTQQHFSFNAHDLRDFSDNKSRRIDDRPFGGGPGMVMCPEPIAQSIEHCKAQSNEGYVIYLNAQGEPLKQHHVEHLATHSHLILLCGRYRGVDERILDTMIDAQYSIGDFIVSGGELPALMLIDAIVRTIKGVLGNKESYANDSFTEGWLSAPLYTRPRSWRGHEVPQVLLQGDHAQIEKWDLDQKMKRTKKRRPDLSNKVKKQKL